MKMSENEEILQKEIQELNEKLMQSEEMIQIRDQNFEEVVENSSNYNQKNRCINIELDLSEEFS
jgi:endonuclease III-like uncharacterized protein